MFYSIISFSKDSIRNIHHSLKELFCNHNWLFWHTRFIVNNPKSHIKHLNGKIQYNQFRQCERCGKKQKWKQKFEGSKWIRTYRKLDINNRTIDMVLKILGEETKADKRDRLIDQILKNK